jgi:tetratricopeptide (TPR) repeat protein/mono/diheme cytochrome c family protein
MTRRLSAPAACGVLLAVSVLAAELIEDGERGRVRAQRSPVTFTRHVAPILFKSCATCHRPEGAAPFSLLTYENARSHAVAIVAATRDRRMPPWKPEPGYGDFMDERRLTGDEIRTIARWLDEGLLEGDPAQLPSAPSWNGAWQLGTPDVVVETTPYTLRVSSDDIYRNFVLPIEVSTTRYVRAWEFLPGSGAVHHATMQFDPTHSSRRLDEQDLEPGYEGLVPHSAMSPDGYFLGWLPGLTSNVAPPGMAWPLQSGADLIMMLHLKPSGRAETIQAKLGLYFSDVPPRLQPTLIRMTRQHMDIPAGERGYVVTDTFPLDADVDLYTIQPHAHLLAKEVKSYATLPDGTRKWLIYIRDWDFNWQGSFRYKRPEFLPAGTTITCEFSYDNSASNPHNPHTPPRRVTYGQHTTDEMAELWLQVVTRNAADRARLMRAVRERIVREEIIGTEKRLETDPDNVALHDDVALLHAEAGHLDRTAEHFAHTARIRPESAVAQYNLGNALFRQERRAEAIAALRRSLALDPNYTLAHDGLGVALYADGQVTEATEHYQRAVELDPLNADARHHLAIALRRLGRLREAIAQYRELLARNPSRDDLKAELADVERQLTK